MHIYIYSISTGKETVYPKPLLVSKKEPEISKQKPALVSNKVTRLDQTAMDHAPRATDPFKTPTWTTKPESDRRLGIIIESGTRQT